MASDVLRWDEERRGIRQYLRSSVLAGLARTVPILVTIFVLTFALNVLSGLLDPLVAVIQRVVGLNPTESQIALQILTATALALVVLLVGIFAESEYGSGRIEPRVDSVLSSIPGLGAVYETLDEMVSVFMPTAPNPFMGGFVLHVAADRVHDIEMSVEEGIQSTVSSGIAVDENVDGSRDYDAESGYGVGR
jgi:uncharacterized membrane protein